MENILILGGDRIVGKYIAEKFTARGSNVYNRRVQEVFKHHIQGECLRSHIEKIFSEEG